MREPIIAVDRDSKSWAVFDGVANLVKPFTRYADEDKALVYAKAWVAEKAPGVTARVVYPSVTSKQSIVGRAVRGISQQFSGASF